MQAARDEAAFDRRRRRQLRAPAALAADHLRRGQRGDRQARTGLRAVRGRRLERRRGPATSSTCRTSTPPTLRAILDDAHRRKAARSRVGPRAGSTPTHRLTGRVLAMIFERNSTRTRFSFDAAIRQLGGSGIISTASDMQLGRGETIEDTAQGAVAHGRRRHDALRQPREDRETGRRRDHPGDQRPHRRRPSVPGHGRPDDLEENSATSRDGPSAGSATATTSAPASSRRRPNSATASPSPRRRPIAPNPALIERAAADQGRVEIVDTLRGRRARRRRGDLRRLGLDGRRGRIRPGSRPSRTVPGRRSP